MHSLRCIHNLYILHQVLCDVSHATLFLFEFDSRARYRWHEFGMQAVYCNAFMCKSNCLLLGLAMGLAPLQCVVSVLVNLQAASSHNLQSQLYVRCACAHGAMASHRDCQLSPNSQQQTP
jgi:hypothetical protein